jgi:hypothetical protein
VSPEQFFQCRGHALIHVLEAFPARIRAGAWVREETSIRFGIVMADVVPGAAFPVPDVTLDEGIDRLRYEAVGSGEDGRRLHSAAHRAAIAAVEGVLGQVIAGGFGLADTEGCQRRIVASALQARGLSEVGLGRSVTDQVEEGRQHGLRAGPLRVSGDEQGPEGGDDIAEVALDVEALAAISHGAVQQRQLDGPLAPGAVVPPQRPLAGAIAS